MSAPGPGNDDDQLECRCLTVPAGGRKSHTSRVMGIGS